MAEKAEQEQTASRMLDRIHLPEDAGEYQEGLRRILHKIPDGWGRWIDCGRGWYPIIVELDRELEALMPGYQVHQVKEKFGTLRYYYELPQEKDPYTQQNPEPPATEDQLWIGWHQGWNEWQETLPGKTYQEKIQGLEEAAHALVREAEEKSAHTCERCGNPGQLRGTHWLKTLCDQCAQ